ncbi:hypothetical protein Cyrtocomes_00676 [Candidatus Cyrtobacter comes]|uniref:Uncharacterized protein n=1 Tax=Candidatus Cyrtobacter comes TaxID=675776 RepID=A0ABU5L847_9RICK|nr:hypothetical protein [Candidatus Cyrtobacter comes]
MENKIEIVELGSVDALVMGGGEIVWKVGFFLGLEA